MLRLLLNDEEKTLLDFQRSGYFVETGWFQSLNNKKPLDSNGYEIPWFTYPSVAFLDKRVQKGLKIFEYGSGASSIYFQKKGAELYSVEYDQTWYEKLKQSIIEPNKIYFVAYSEKSAEAYINAIDTPGIQFDVVVIDGRARVECCRKAVDSLNASGVLILDDSERKRYAECFSIMTKKGFRYIEFWGISAGDYNLKCTTVFYKPNNCLGI
jgi:tRNA A58 N-methylase Trm61